MRIAWVSSEMTPFAQTGGLGDVAGALPAVLVGLNHQVTALLPKYRTIDLGRHLFTSRPEKIQVSLGDRTEVAGLWEGQRGSVRVILLDHDGFYDREGLYQDKGVDYPDNPERFIFFSRGVLEALKVLNWRPDVIHCHDWQTGLVPAYLKRVYGSDPYFAGVASLLTIHNLGYQGVFSAQVFPLTGLPGDLFTPGGVEFWGKVNFLKSGLIFADLLNTVSLTYSQEIQTPEFGYGLDAVLGQRATDLFGVLNGVDYQDWNPRTDPYLVGTYSSEDLTGKAACKRDIQEMMGLPTRAEVLLCGVVSRLAYQKGIDLIVATAERLLSLDVQIVLLGTGDVELERALQDLHRRFPDRLGVEIRFDVALSHKIVAGADIVLIPSRYEPCGLNQMYALAYGTIPVVRATGGLRDTIIPFDPGEGTGNGFVFTRAEAGDLLEAVRQAIALFRDRAVWRRLMAKAMAADFSWKRPAREYEQLYRLALERRRHPTR
jgi:starch synthase